MPPRYLLLGAFALSVLLAVSTVAGQEASEPPKPKPDYSSEDVVDEDDSTKLTFENDGTGTRETSSRVRVQSDAGVKRYGVLTFPYQSLAEALEIVYVRVLKPGGTVATTPGESIQDMPAAITREAPFYSDLREKHVSVRGLGVGDVLEFRAIWRVTKPLVPGEFWLSIDSPSDEIVLRSRVQVSFPRERAVKWTSSKSKPAITEEGGRRTFTWTSSRPTHKSDEQKKADDAEVIYQATRSRLPSPEVVMSSFTSWEAVGAWYDGLIRDRVQPTAEIRAKAAELTRNAKDEDAKVRALYNYVSTQIRYIGVAFGIGRYQPHPAAEVLSNQYGDCKDKHALLAALLSAEGIRAYPALINSSRVIDEAVPSPGQFDHLITAVPRGDGFLWLDTTPEVASFGYLVGGLRDKRSLVIPAGRQALLVTTPADPPAPSLQTFRMKAKLGDDGTLEGTAECSLDGDDSEVALRAALRRTSMQEWKDIIQAIVQQSGFGGEVSDVTVTSAANTEEPLRWTYRYTRKEYSDWPNRRIIAPLPPMWLLATEEKPFHPIWLGATGELRFESLVELPKGSAPRLPPDLDLKEAFASYTARYALEDGTWRTERRLVIKRREVLVADYEAYRKFANAVQDDHAAFIDLKAAVRITPASYQEAIWELPYSENAEAAEAYDDARSAFQRHDAQGEIASLKRAVAIDPGFTRAWLWMGEIYRSQAKVGPALQAYRSAIKSDPREPLSYKVLAFNLMSLGRLEEAVATWRQLVEISAEDADAFAFLGSTLQAARRHREAVSALESAIKLDPDRAEVAVQLGTAYTHVGEEAKALAALKRGLEKDPQPMWFNAAASALAEVNMQLPLALEYAEKAVRAEEDASAKISLSNLKMEDLVRTVRLAVFWDTLGWACAQSGQLGRAEKYLYASWMLSQLPIAGDHLGQLYERLRRPRDAARMYGLALASDRGRAIAQLKETQARLDRVRGKIGGDGGESAGARPELTELRTVKLQPLISATASAEFFLLVGSGPKVEDVRFISGSPKLKAAGKALRSAALRTPFPGDGNARAVRRVVVSCASIKGSGCSLVLYPPEVVRSLE